MRLIKKIKALFIQKSKELKVIAARLQYTFSNAYFLEKALTHRSVQHHSLGNYERLEFVGDAVIGYFIHKSALMAADNAISCAQTMIKIIEDGINPILNNYINENNVSLLMDKKNILMGKSNLDITSLIVEKLDKKLPSLNLK